MKNSSNNSLLSAGLIAAIASSLCCIVPVIAAVASVSGIAASFSWLEPIRPFLIGFTMIVLGLAWYQHLKNRREMIECDCDPQEISFWRSTKFMGLITVFAALMLSFPYYSGVFFSSSGEIRTDVNQKDIAEARLEIEGMTCDGCEHHVTQTLVSQEAVIEASSSYKEGIAMVKFDKTRTTLDELSRAVEKETGYAVTDQEILH